MFMSHFCQMAGHNMLFKPPPRPRTTDWTAGHSNRFARSIEGFDVHCQLVTPFDRPTSINAYCVATDGANGILLASHGNAEDVSSFHSYAQYLADRLDMPVLTYDYPGYGFTSGHACATDENMFSACNAALSFIVDSLKHDIRDVIVFGKSIGTVPSVQLASQPHMAQIAGLILVSPLASAARCLITPTYSSYLPQSLLTSMDLLFGPSVHRIKDISCLLLVVHGTEDKIVPASNAHELLHSSPIGSYYPPLFVEAGHNDIESQYNGIFFDTLQNFITTCRDKQRAQSHYD